MSDYTSWYVGMKVVCIKDGAWTLYSGPIRREPMPLQGAVYTISHIEAEADDVFVALGELSETALFKADRFRPLAPRKSDISIFRSILNGHRI